MCQVALGPWPLCHGHLGLSMRPPQDLTGTCRDVMYSHTTTDPLGCGWLRMVSGSLLVEGGAAMYVCGSVTKHVGRRPNTHHRLHLMVHIWHMHLCCMVGPLHPQSWRRGPVKRCQPIMPSPVSVRTYATRHCIAAEDLAWLARSGKYCRYCSMGRLH